MSCRSDHEERWEDPQWGIESMPKGFFLYCAIGGDEHGGPWWSASAPMVLEWGRTRAHGQGRTPQEALYNLRQAMEVKG